MDGNFCRDVSLFKQFIRDKIFSGEIVYPKENHYKPYTKKQQQEIVDLLSSGVPPAAIAIKYGREKEALRTFICRKGLHKKAIRKRLKFIKTV